MACAVPILFDAFDTVFNVIKLKLGGTVVCVIAADIDVGVVEPKPNCATIILIET